MPAEVLSFIGGTGPEGLGLAARFAAAGYEIVIGSRSPQRGQENALTPLLPQRCRYMPFSFA
jgi:hypothetical protein